MIEPMNVTGFRSGIALALAVALGATLSWPARAAGEKPATPQPPGWVDRAGKAIENTARKVGEGAAKVGDKVGEGAKKVGAAVDRGAQTAAKKVGIDATKKPDAAKKSDPAPANR